MATEVLDSKKQCDSERVSSFLDFKMKRRRLSEIIGNNGKHSSDSDNQSTVSSESGYFSQTDRNSVWKSSPKELYEDTSESETQDNVKDQKVENEEGRKGNLVLPPPYFYETPSLHIGVAYVSFESNLKDTDNKSDGLKVGLIPVMDNVLPISLKGLAGINNQNFPKGAHPLFMTTMPTGFVMTSTGPSAVMANHDIPVSTNAGQKHKLNKEEAVKHCPSKKVMTKDSESEFINHYTNGMFEYLGHVGGLKAKDTEKKAEQTKIESTNRVADNAKYDNKYPMVCGICNDKATGLHYGIITCEG